MTCVPQHGQVDFARLEVEVTLELHAVETRVDPADIESPEALAYEIRLRNLHDAVESIAGNRRGIGRVGPATADRSP